MSPPSAVRALLDVRLTPRASRVSVEVDGELVRVRVAAPPVAGRANAALVRLLAKRLGVARRDVSIVRGQSSRTKRVAVEGVSAASAFRRLREP